MFLSVFASILIAYAYYSNYKNELRPISNVMMGRQDVNTAQNGAAVKYNISIDPSIRVSYRFNSYNQCQIVSVDLRSYLSLDRYKDILQCIFQGTA